MDHLHLLAGAVGVLSHQFYFKAGEHHLYPLRSLLRYTAIIIATALALSVSKAISLYDFIRATAGLVVAYLAGLYISLILYRAHFHPLKHIPGPYGARFSGLWFSVRLHGIPAYKVLHGLHARYGPIVRVGPSNVSIIHPQAVTQIYGPSSKCTKSSFYDNGHPMRSLHAYRSRAEHDQRRRVWSTGFSDARLRGYESRIRVYRQKLFDRLISLGQTSTTDISTWFNFYSYDVMGDLAFARSFGMLDTRNNHWAIDVLLAGIVPFGYYLPSWVFRCLVTVPSLSKDFHHFVGFATQTLVERMNTKVEIPDICASFLASLKGESPTPDQFSLLMGDAMLVITAGSDTTATSLTSIVYELARHPQEVDKLRAELQLITPDDLSSGEYLHSQIANLPHLNGFINETLRLHPPIPSVIPRDTPPEGLTINVDGMKTHIPGAMTVFCPQWAIGRSADSYVEPLSFIPERWYDRPEYIKAREAYSPFSSGAYSCIGKPLALMNIRTTIARLIMTFDISLPESQDKDAQVDPLDNAKDHFSMGIESMVVRLVLRDWKTTH
ncbi:cytochrome P450 [Talaromyces proteolyticus]|uniref:Cytochrome P450 n=1 Tax=Talaromyces proteolyticus TaxID=1131652 RepID=A0AAD4PTA2_9EURO|nr:cytochrome P450 [Talaromyces proteolyticus]KAH8692970.1 cytochrome P450 [Talaromyces proteolyticus]